MNLRISVIIMAVAAILTTNLASATIQGSVYEERHQSLIENAIYQNCGIFGELQQISSSEIENRIDNGITDIYFKTDVLVRSRIDQNIFEYFIVSVQSLYTDAYDHESKNWGVYSIEDISSHDLSCSQINR